MSKEITNKMIERFAEEAIGESTSVYELFERHFPGEDFMSLPMEQLLIFDDIAFTCDNCGWIYEISEDAGVEDEKVCLSCADNDEEFDW